MFGCTEQDEQENFERSVFPWLYNILAHCHLSTTSEMSIFQWFSSAQNFMRSFWITSALDYHHVCVLLYNTGHKATTDSYMTCTFWNGILFLTGYFNSSDRVMPSAGWFHTFIQFFTQLLFCIVMKLHHDYLQSYRALWATSTVSCLSNEEVQDNATL